MNADHQPEVVRKYLMEEDVCIGAFIVEPLKV